jgi:peptidyl-prolyl cis-trans isomerase SurA
LILSYIIPNSHAELLNRIVAIVEDDVITLKDLDEKARLFFAMNPSLVEKDFNRSDLMKDILNQLIEEKLAEKKARELGIKVTDSEVKEAIERVKKINGLSDEELNRQLLQAKMTFEDYKNQIKSQLEKEKLLSQEIKGKVVVSEDSILSYYQMHKSRFQEPSAVRISSIFMPIEGGSVERTLEVARDLRRRIRAGDSFETLAKEFSWGPGKDVGGDLGYFEVAQLHPEIRRIVADLSVGDVSEPFVLGNYVQILKVTEKSGGRERSFEEVKEIIRELLYEQELEKRFKAFVEDLRSSSYVKVMY